MKNLISRNPSRNYEKIGEVKISSKKDVTNKINQAREISESWKSDGLEVRVGYMRKLFDCFSGNKEDLARLESKEMGMPIKEGRMDIDAGLDYFSWYLENASKYISPEVTFESKEELHKVYYDPIGVAAVIVPWNFPFSNFIWGVIPNLIVGNTVVFKHSEEVSLFGQEMEETVDQCNFPSGVFGGVYGGGEIGEMLTDEDIDLICFTGSSKVGRKLYKKAADKFIKIVLELGGSAPGVVFGDADLDMAIENIFANRFLNCGQVCDGLKRAIVHNDLFDDFVNKMIERIKKVQVGDALDEKTDIGPLVAKRQQKLIKEQLRDAVRNGANIEIGGKPPVGLKGAYFEPTLVTNIKRDMRIWKEEVFGPILPVVSFKTEKEAVELANDTQYGLGAYVYTKDKRFGRKIASKIKSGMVSINGAFYVLPCNPFGGCKLSGIGREHGKFGLRELCGIKVIAEKK